jgi:hypothetical protein
VTGEHLSNHPPFPSPEKPLYKYISSLTSKFPRLEFSREWNIPVHNFLRRHVYFSSKTHFSGPVAMFITFVVSSIGHELVMGCITKKLRGYGFLAMMSQLPIVAIQRSKFVRGRRVLNVSFSLSSSPTYYVILGRAAVGC